MESALAARKYQIIIADESHYLKNSRAIRTKILVPILQMAERVLLLTGTPALSRSFNLLSYLPDRPFELFNQLQILDKLTWYDEKEFCKRYCSGSGG